MAFWLKLTLIILFIGLLYFIWYLSYKAYMKNAVKYYNENVINLNIISVQSDAIEKLMKLYFNRQQTYEFSAYAILVISLIILSGCLYVFFNTEQLMNLPDLQDLEQAYWISIVSLRLGISIVVFFTCQVLLKLYRYCMKVAVFYMGMFDALMMNKYQQIDLKEAIVMFMPLHDPGEIPENPTLELMKAIAATKKT